MPDERDKPNDVAKTGVVQRLVAETGITEGQAAYLISALGTDWASLVREARIMKRR